MLNEKNIHPKLDGMWTSTGVGTILKNEKYAGNLMLQKFYSENHLTKRKMKNDGRLPMVYVEEAHDAIIEPEIFQAVQERLSQQQKFTPEKSTTGKYPFTGMIYCKCCEKNYRRKTTKTGIVWICTTYNTRGKMYCPTAKQIPENTLYDVCCDILHIPEFNEFIFKNYIKRIVVPEPNKLIFEFNDGHKELTEWEDRSRSESRTDEMRLKCGERRRRWHEK